jgi:hypothetical protein
MVKMDKKMNTSLSKMKQERELFSSKLSMATIAFVSALLIIAASVLILAP